MNTRKQVLLMSGLLMMMLIITGIYAAWYPSRADQASAAFEERTVERGSILFARNCRLCHGDVGEGGALAGRLTAAPPLDRADLQGFEDSGATIRQEMGTTTTSFEVSNPGEFETGDIILIDEERMEITGKEGNSLTVRRAVGHTRAAGHFTGAPIFLFSATELTDAINLMRDTISCGRVGTAMPAWSQQHNGPLSDEQIRQLIVVISTGRWEPVKNEVDHEDEIDSHLTAPVDADTISLRVSDVSVFTQNEVIRLGEERLRVVAVPTVTPDQADLSGIIQVERGVRGTFPLEHSQETHIFRYPLAPEPTILQTSCGQTARPAAPAGTPGLVEPFEGQTVQVVARNVLFDTNQITVQRNGQVRVRLDNQDTDVEHNIAFYQSRTNLTPVAPGSVGLLFDGPGIDDTVFDIPAAGDYFFRCDVHPSTMTGTFTVQ